MKDNLTIVISCAGMGSRLGIGSTKALVEICGKPLIIHQLEMLKDFQDICIVVGYQADKVMKLVSEYRSDVRFAFNHEYKTTGTGASLSKALIAANEYIVTLDGDLLVHPKDLKDFLTLDYECIAGCLPSTDNPVLMKINNNTVINFSRQEGDLEWTGLAKIKTEHLTPGNGHVYQMLEHLLPLPVKLIRSKEIDTMNDYENAVRWINNNYSD